TGNAGIVTVKAGGNLTVNPAFLNANAQTSGKGAVLTLTAGATLSVSGALNADAVGNLSSSNKGGQIFLQGAAIKFTGTGGLFNLSANGSGSGDGGTVSYRATSNTS